MPSLRTSIIEAARAGRHALLAAALALAAAAPTVAQDEPALLRLHVEEPRAFGYQVGDVVTRVLDIELPSRLHLDEASLPGPGRQGTALELLSVQRALSPTAGGQRLSVRLEYQVFASPPAVRSYDLPAFTLRFEGTPKAEELRVESWPMMVSPLSPPEVSARRGLGELQPDEPAPLRDTRPERALLMGCAVVAVLLGAYLAFIYVGLPWSARAKRPFGRTYRALRRGGKGAAASSQEWQQACRALHAAFNETAGRAVFADTLEAFFARAPRFAPLGADIRSFFSRSQAGFFEAEAEPAQRAGTERAWLLGFARACRDAERGSG